MGDLKSSTITATGEVYGARARVKYLSFVNTVTAGSVVLRDGGSGGTVLLNIASPPLVGRQDIQLPENGIAFGTDVYATLTNVSSLTVVYGG